jgi:hypothetical protein
MRAYFQRSVRSLTRPEFDAAPGHDDGLFFPRHRNLKLAARHRDHRTRGGLILLVAGPALEPELSLRTTCGRGRISQSQLVQPQFSPVVYRSFWLVWGGRGDGNSQASVPSTSPTAPGIGTAGAYVGGGPGFFLTTANDVMRWADHRLQYRLIHHGFRYS